MNGKVLGGLEGVGLSLVDWVEFGGLGWGWGGVGGGACMHAWVGGCLGTWVRACVDEWVGGRMRAYVRSDHSSTCHTRTPQARACFRSQSSPSEPYAKVAKRAAARRKTCSV